MDVPLLHKTHNGPRTQEDSQDIERFEETSARRTSALQRSPRRRQRESWDPAAEFAELYDRVDRLGRELFWPTAHDAQWPLARWTPRADVEETADAYVVEIDLPGVKREDISLEFSSGELFVSGEIKQRERHGIWRSRTRRIGHFDYQVSLPAGLDPDHVHASLNDGLLTIRAAKTEQAKRRKIAISKPHPDASQALPPATTGV